MATARSSTTRQRLLRLVEELPDSEWTAAERYLTYLRTMGDPLACTIVVAPYDEPVTPTEQTAVEKAMEDVATGRINSHKSVVRRSNEEVHV